MLGIILSALCNELSMEGYIATLTLIQTDLYLEWVIIINVMFFTYSVFNAILVSLYMITHYIPVLTR